MQRGMLFRCLFTLIAVVFVVESSKTRTDPGCELDGIIQTGEFGVAMLQTVTTHTKGKFHEDATPLDESPIVAYVPRGRVVAYTAHEGGGHGVDVIKVDELNPSEISSMEVMKAWYFWFYSSTTFCMLMIGMMLVILHAMFEKLLTEMQPNTSRWDVKSKENVRAWKAIDSLTKNVPGEIPTTDQALAAVKVLEDALKEQTPTEQAGLTAKIQVSIVGATGLKQQNRLSRGFWVQCNVVKDGGQKPRSSCQTSSFQNAVAPNWDATHEVNWCAGDVLEFTVYDKGMLTSRAVGRAMLVSDFFKQESFDGKLLINGLCGATLHVRVGK